jgi:hypothetical protein
MHIIGGVKGEAGVDREAPGRSWLLLAGVLAILIGYWAPWVGHPVAGLVQNGFDLSEFVKFLPQVKNGSESLLRWLLFLPLPTTALSLSLWAATESRRCLSGRNARWLRAVLAGVSLLLLVILIPPYPYTLGRLWGEEFRARTMMALASWATFPLTLFSSGRWLTRRQTCVLVALLTLAGTAGSIIQFLSLRDALSVVYGRPVSIGWGVWVMVAGMSVILGSMAPEFRLARERPPSNRGGSAARRGHR